MDRRSLLKMGGLALGFAALQGCNKAPLNTVTNFTLSGGGITEAMTNINCNPLSTSIRDSRYSLPSVEFVKGSFSAALKSFFFVLDDNHWKAEENDCDDFALGATFFMSFLHHNTHRKMSESGIAFGEFHYVTKTGAGHAINVFLARDEKGETKVLFYEPQTYSMVSLEAKEIESCVFWRF